MIAHDNDFPTMRHVLLTVTLLIFGAAPLLAQDGASATEIRVGIIGLDTSHSPSYARLINETDSSSLAGIQVVAAYPKGNPNLEPGERIPRFTKEMREMGIEIVDSIDELLTRVDAVMLETRDGRMHLDQALPVLEAGKPLYVDAPLAGNLGEAVAIFEAGRQMNTPVFTAEPLRYSPATQDIAAGSIGDVLGADSYSPAATHPTHPDLFWYGGHGVAMLYTVMGTGCEHVRRVHRENTDVVVGTWADGRIGTYRGTRTGERGYGGSAFGTDGIANFGGFEGYLPLVLKIGEFFHTGEPPVPPEESLEIYAFMAAADESKTRDGEAVSVQAVLEDARTAAHRTLEAR